MVDEYDLRVVAFGNLPNQVNQPFGLRLGESRAGLVEEDHTRAADDALRHLDQTALEHAELAAMALGGLETHKRQRLTDGGVVSTELVGRHPDIVIGRQRVDDLLLLEGPAQPPARPAMRGHAEQVRPLGIHATARWLDEAAEDVEQSRLAGTIGTDQAADAGRQLERDAVKRPYAAEGDRELMHVQHGAFPPVGRYGGSP